MTTEKAQIVEQKVDYFANVKIFDKWDPRGITVEDPGLIEYINLQPRAIPHSFGRAGAKRFGKKHYNLIERLANDLMVTGHVKDSRIHKKTSGRDTGKKQTTLRLIRKGFEIIEKKTKQNPVQVLVNAVTNTSPREETTRIRQGGIIVHKAVDVAPQRRLDTAIRFISHGAAQRCFKKRYTLPAALADEIIAASNYDTKTYSVSKKEETERVAHSAP
ncbi:TPA: 30S ribosomal protein S7 [archaeon]|nr:30S ribosomal protein S7 [Candidatus Naiadarchaeales archaeon SRR2090153.bin1042]